MTSHFVEFLWHENSQTEFEKKKKNPSAASVQSLLLEALHECASAHAMTACDSARHAWHTGCVFLCVTGYFVILQSGSSFCSPSEWWSLAAVQIDMTHSPAGSLFSWPVCLVQCHLPVTNSTYRGWTVRENHSTALITSLHHFIHSWSLWTLSPAGFKVQ